MKKPIILTVVAAFGLLSVMVSLPVRQAHAEGNTSEDFVSPLVFQAAGPTIESIQSSVDAFRAALGEPNNGNDLGPIAIGRREINWDGGGSTDTAIVPTPFEGFLVTRGARFTTSGTGFVQAPLDGLVTTFGNKTYDDTIFQTFSPFRLFSPIGSNITRVRFFVPGGSGMPATTTGFGAVFTDVDRPDGRGSGREFRNSRASTLVQYFGADGKLLFSSFVPASLGDGSLSFFGIVFDEALIARVRIRSSNFAPGPDDDGRHDIVVMDDFFYGEPQLLH